MRRVVLMSWVAVTESVSQQMHAGELLSSGRDVECWDLSRACLPRISAGRRAEGIPLRFFERMRDVLDAVSDAARSGCVFLPYFPPAFETLRIYRRLSELRPPVAFIATGFLPPKRQEGGKVGDLVWNAFRPDFLRGRLKNLAVRGGRRAGWVRPYDVVFGAGSAALEAHSGAARSVPFNFFDYEEHRRLLGGPRDTEAPRGRYCVFLDNGFPNHPDFDVLGIPKLDAAAYRDGMCGFFDRLESQVGAEVVVAAHPKADLSADRFGGRRVVEGGTGALVRDCEFVLAHMSASTSFAVLNRKPVLFLHSEQIRSLYRYSYWPWIQAFAEELRMPLVDVGSRGAVSVRPADEVAYRAYRYRYLTTPQSEGRRNCDILTENLP